MRRFTWAVAFGGVFALAAFFAGHRAAGSDTAPLAPDALAGAVLIEKSAHRMSLIRQGQVLAVYRVSLGRGGPEAKRPEGDNRVPEGAYRIEARNARSAYHLALKISYPERRDVEAAAARGEPAGSNIMIHGLRNGLGMFGGLHRLVDWTAGCIAVTNSEMDAIWRAVPDGTPVEIRS